MDDQILIENQVTKLEMEITKIKRKVNKSINRLSTIKALMSQSGKVRRTLPAKPSKATTMEIEDIMRIKGYVLQKKARNMKTTSMRSTLPELGLRPNLTAEWLLEEGYLMFAPRVGTDGDNRKVPTAKGKTYFTAEHTNGLYINGLGCSLLSRLREQGVIPAYCHTAVRQ